MNSTGHWWNHLNSRITSGLSRIRKAIRRQANLTGLLRALYGDIERHFRNEKMCKRCIDVKIMPMSTSCCWRVKTATASKTATKSGHEIAVFTQDLVYHHIIDDGNLARIFRYRRLINGQRHGPR
jgi:hypothetical protein